MAKTTAQASELAGLGLSKQTVQALVAGGVTTLASLEAKRDKLGEIKGIGPQTVKQLHDLLGAPPLPPQEKPPGLGADADDEPGETKRPRQGEVVVMCPYCGVRCESNRSDPLFTRYYCPNKKQGCHFSQKVPRPDISARAKRLRAREEEDVSARA